VVIILDPLSLSYYPVTKFQAYILLTLDLFSQFYSYSIPLADRAKQTKVQLQIQYEIHVLVMGLS
jgi:hypothetical protein